MTDKTKQHLAEIVLRVALAAGFLSAVADRFGLSGPPGESGVAWGAWGPFVAYVGTLNWFLPVAVIPSVAWVATCLEITLAGALLIGWRLRWVAAASGLLLLSFAVTMAVATGVKGPLDYSVLGVAAGAWYLGMVGRPGVEESPTPGI